jgi:SAM-dependent methyltransferase
LKRTSVLDVKRKFASANARWWGDHLDVRFFLARRLQEFEGKKILDVGCGPGVLLSELPGSNEKFGVDSDAGLARSAKKLNPKAVVKRASMYRLPFPKNFFDVVVMANVVPGADFLVPPKHRSALQKKALSEVARVLKRDGVLFLTTPNNSYYKTNKLSFNELDALLKPLFEFEIKGWNPFPKFPFFLPARVLARVPGWFSFLARLCLKGFFAKSSKFFYVEARLKIRKR